MPGPFASEGHELPPPPSQSHFAKFEHFSPNSTASFDDEFARLALSQHRNSLTTPTKKSSVQREKTLQGYRALGREVGIDPSDSVAECKRNLKKTLVNIVDLIDARRTGKRVKVWNNFEEFRAYTLQDEKRIDLHEAKQPPGYLASLLQRLSGPSSRKAWKRNGSRGSRVAPGRITK